MEKSSRVLILFYRLLQREHIRKANFAMEFHTTERSIDRDIHTIRLVLLELHSTCELVFDKTECAYYLVAEIKHEK